MNKKGFTLMELLGVVIILTALTFLVLPNITNSLKSHEEKTNEATLDLIKTATKLHIADNKKYYKKIDDKKYCIKVSKLVKKGYLEEEFQYNNENITDTKSIQVTYNQGFEYELVDNDECIGDSIGCTVISGDGTKTGDEIECANEHFYVISNENGRISMLSKYNLNVGDNIYQDDLVGVQSSNAKGFTNDNNYGTVQFSETNYWYNEDTSSIKEKYKNYFVYDENSSLYKYIKKYEDYLKERGVESCNATLINGEQLVILGCDISDISCLDSKYKWVYSTSYWSGSLFYNSSPLAIYSNGSLHNLINYDDNEYGLRPVINMSISEL